MENPTVEELIAFSTNSFDDWAAKAQKDGVDVDERVQRILPLLLKLTDPAFLDFLEKMLSKRAQLEQLLDMADEVPGVFTAGMDTLDSLISRLQGQGIDPDKRLHNIIKIMDILTSDNVLRFLELCNLYMEKFIHLGDKFLATDTLNEKFAGVFKDATRSLLETKEESPKPISGVFAMLGALKDRDVSKAIGFGIHFAKKFGQTLKPK